MLTLQPVQPSLGPTEFSDQKFIGICPIGTTQPLSHSSKGLLSRLCDTFSCHSEGTVGVVLICHDDVELALEAMVLGIRAGMMRTQSERSHQRNCLVERIESGTVR